MKLLKEKEGANILVLGGGVIPKRDIPALKGSGIAEVFGPGTPTSEIVRYIKTHVDS